jgi:hypothetical protein
MSEATDAVPANFNDTLSLSTDQTAAMRAQWVGLGLDADQFDKAASGAPQEPAQTDDASPAALDLNSQKQPSLASGEALAMAEELIRAGVPADQVDAALKADGYTFEEDPRSEEEIEHDRMFGAAPPSEYRVDYQGRIPAGADMAKMAQANAEVTTWLSLAGFSPEIGPAVAERAMDAGQACARMSDVDRQLWAGEQRAEFARMAGSPERATELLDLVSVTLTRGGNAFGDLLARSGALDDAGVLMHLAHQGERLKARSGK